MTRNVDQKGVDAYKKASAKAVKDARAAKAKKEPKPTQATTKPAGKKSTTKKAKS